MRDYTEGKMSLTAFGWLAVLLLSLALGAQTNATPLENLRSLWVIGDSTQLQLANPARSVQAQTPQTTLDLSHQLLVRSSARQSATWTLAGNQLMPLAHGALQLGVRRTGTGFRLSFTNSQVAARPQRQHHLDLTYSTSLGKRLDLGISGRAEPWSTRLQGRVGAYYRVHEQWTAAVYGGRTFAQQRYEIGYGDEEVELHQQAPRLDWGGALGTVAGRLRLVFAGQGGTWTPSEQEEGYLLDLQGDWYAVQGSWEGRISEGLLLLGDLRYRHLAGKAQGHLKYSPFLSSQLAYRDRAGTLWLRYRAGSGRRLDWGVLFNRGTGQVQRGQLESWPFISSLESLLGGKDWSFWGDADFELAGLALRLLQPFRHGQLESEARFFRLTGAYAATSRERSKFDFGSLFFPETHQARADLRAEAIDLSLAATFCPASWGLRYRLVQLIPLRVSPARRTFEGRNKGGQQHHLSVVYTPGSPR